MIPGIVASSVRRSSGGEVNTTPYIITRDATLEGIDRYTLDGLPIDSIPDMFIAISGDGTYVLTGGGLFNVVTGKELPISGVIKDAVLSERGRPFRPDMASLISNKCLIRVGGSTSFSGRIYCLNLGTGEHVQIGQDVLDEITLDEVTISRDGTLAAFRAGTSLYIADTDSGDILQEIPESGEWFVPVDTMLFSSDNSKLIAHVRYRSMRMVVDVGSGSVESTIVPSGAPLLPKMLINSSKDHVAVLRLFGAPTYYRTLEVYDGYDFTGTPLWSRDSSSEYSAVFSWDGELMYECDHANTDAQLFETDGWTSHPTVKIGNNRRNVAIAKP